MCTIAQDKRRYGRGSMKRMETLAGLKLGGSTRNLLDLAESGAEPAQQRPDVPAMQLEKGDSHSVSAFMTQLEDAIATARQDGEGNTFNEQVEEELESNWRDYYSSGSNSDSEIEDETIHSPAVSAVVNKGLLLKVHADCIFSCL
jgi:hypothetical protein